MILLKKISKSLILQRIFLVEICNLPICGKPDGICPIGRFGGFSTRATQKRLVGYSVENPSIRKILCFSRIFPVFQRSLHRFPHFFHSFSDCFQQEIGNYQIKKLLHYKGFLIFHSFHRPYYSYYDIFYHSIFLSLSASRKRGIREGHEILSKGCYHKL